MMIALAGDIGGTKTELGLYDECGAEIERARFASRDYDGLEAVLAEFLRGRRAEVAVFAVAGPVHAGRCKTTNLPWELDERSLAAMLGARVTLLNDLAAALLGISELRDADLAWLAHGERDPLGPIAALGAGTGLGEAIGVPTADGLRVLASEGGHADFAPRDETEIELLRFLQSRHGGRVSIERAVSGPGLVAIYELVLARGLAPSSRQARAEVRDGDAAEVIGRRGSAGDDPACALALSIFVSLYGAEAGNLALKAMPTGGLFVVGGMAPKLLERLRRGDFMQALLDKGRMAEVLDRIPVAVVMSPHVALVGARARARDMLYRTNRAATQHR